MAKEETRMEGRRSAAESPAAESPAAALVAIESRGLEAPTAVRGLEQRAITGGTELWVKPLGVGLGQWSQRAGVRLVTNILLLTALDAVLRPVRDHFGFTVATTLFLVLGLALVDLVARVRPQRMAVQEPGRLVWTRMGMDMVLHAKDVVAIEVVRHRWLPWRAKVQAVRTDAGRSVLVSGMRSPLAERVGEVLREALARLPERPPVRPGRGRLSLGPAPGPGAVPEAGDPDLEEIAAVLPLPQGLLLEQPDGRVELEVRRRQAFVAGWRASAFMPAALSVLGTGVATLVFRDMPPELWSSVFPTATQELAAGIVALAFWIQLVSLLLMVLPSTRVHIGQHSIETEHRALRRKQTLTPVDDVSAVRAERMGSRWAVVMQLRDGRARIVASRLPGEAMAHALALWLRVGISRARGAQPPTTQPPSSSSP